MSLVKRALAIRGVFLELSSLAFANPNVEIKNY